MYICNYSVLLSQLTYKQLYECIVLGKIISKLANKGLFILKWLHASNYTTTAIFLANLVLRNYNNSTATVTVRGHSRLGHVF